MQVNFYHVTTTNLNTPLLGSIVANYRKTVYKMLLVVPTAQQAEDYSKILWEWAPESFIAHLVVPNQNLPSASFLKEQRILIQTDFQNHNDAQLAFMIAGVAIENATFEKLGYFFAGYEEKDRLQAQADWEFFLNQGFEMRYYKQKAHKNWERVEPCF